MPIGPHEHVIVGAGPAGCAAAVRLARAGRRPLLLERSARVQPRLCGEFVSAEAVAALRDLGIDVAALGGQPTQRLRLACGTRLVEAELPFTAYGLSRGALDGALQARAEAAGATLWRGARAAVREVGTAQQPHLLQVRVAGAAAVELQASHLLLACGKSDLAPLQRRPARAPEPLVGAQWHLRLQPAQRQALQGHVEVLLFERGYGGLQPIEDGRVNLCLLVQRPSAGTRMSESAPRGAGWPELLRALGDECPLLAQRLRGAQWDAVAPRSIFRVPYGYLHRPSATDAPRLWRLGDQAAVIPSFTGDGVALALHGAARAAEALLAGDTAAAYHQRLRRELRAQMLAATALYRTGHSPTGRALLLAAMQRWPALPGWLARLTRAPGAVL